MYYEICPNCGSNLDPGEKCDCKEKAPDAGTAGNLIKTNKLYLHDTTKEAKCQDDAS